MTKMTMYFEDGTTTTMYFNTTDEAYTEAKEWYWEKMTVTNGLITVTEYWNENWAW